MIASKSLRFIYAATHHQGDACLLWPYAKARRYGKLYYEGRIVSAHRLVCQMVHGDPPSAAHHAAHKCGVRLCISPQHLRWATGRENEADKLLHDRHNRGERNGFAKLTREAVRAIRAQPDKPLGEWVAEYGVSKQTVSKARLRQTWIDVEDAA